jgi:hypothetical protein
MQAKKLDIPSVYVANSVGNLLNCNITSLTGPVGFTMTQPFLLVKHIRLINSDTANRTVTLYKGGTGGSTGGTQFAFAGVVIAANSYVDWYGEARFEAADFLTGVADAASKVIINIDAEIGIQ